jgi:hypothetical protein
MKSVYVRDDQVRAGGPAPTIDTKASPVQSRDRRMICCKWRQPLRASAPMMAAASKRPINFRP